MAIAFFFFFVSGVETRKVTVCSWLKARQSMIEPIAFISKGPLRLPIPERGCCFFPELRQAPFITEGEMPGEIEG